jgi:hypothetical protein
VRGLRASHGLKLHCAKAATALGTGWKALESLSHSRPSEIVYGLILRIDREEFRERGELFCCADKKKADPEVRLLLFSCLNSA